MSDMVVSADGIEKALEVIFEDFKKLEATEIKKAVQASARSCVNDLKATSPKGESGRYSEGWKSKADGDAVAGYKVRIYNSTKPGLTHLLEKPHMLRDGSLSSPIPHIEPAYEKASDDLKRRLS